MRPFNPISHGTDELQPIHLWPVIVRYDSSEITCLSFELHQGIDSMRGGSDLKAVNSKA